MKVGVLTVALYDRNRKDAMEYLKNLGVEAVEIGCGGHPGDIHCKPSVLLNDDAELQKFKNDVFGNGLRISALSCHGNPVHPNKEVAEKFHREFIDTILLAEKLGVDTVVGFSGCPGDCPESRFPNWVTCPWPGEFLSVLYYQWNEVLIPYWKKTAEFAQKHGVNRICLEMHPGFCVYNPETLLKLRAAVGDVIGANFDPSHLMWQGIDPVEAIKVLGDAIYFVHGKDVRLDKANIAKNGVLDTKPYSDIINRAWAFRTLGYGHDSKVWKDIISMLRIVGYDGVISIEHEDSLMTSQEGLSKAVAFLKDVLIKDEVTDTWWA